MSSKATRVMAMAGRCGAALVGAVIVLAVPSLAGAATVAEVDGTVVFTAAPGESNNVTANELNISDAGALLTAGAGCTQVDAHSVTCGEEFTGQLPLVVNAGDRNDRVFLSSDCCRSLSARGGKGNDALTADSHNGAPVDLDGGAGDDDLFSNEQLGGAPVLHGGDGNDRLRIGGGSTVGGQIFGGSGDDYLEWSNGTWISSFPLTLDGGDGDDTYFFGITFVGSSIVPGPGFDTVDQGAAHSGFFFDLSQCTHCVERILGSPQSDYVFGDERTQVISGRGGDDQIDGGGGSDALSGDDGDDNISSADNAIDVVTCGAGADTVAADRRDVVTRSDCETVTRGSAGV